MTERGNHCTLKVFTFRHLVPQHEYIWGLVSFKFGIPSNGFFSQSKMILIN